MEIVIVAKDEDMSKVNEKLKEGWTVKECRPVPSYNFCTGVGGDTKIYVYFVLQKYKQ